MPRANLKRPANQSWSFGFLLLILFRMNWTYIVGGAAVTLTLLGLLHQLLVNRKNATIETLAEKNKWLQEQLDQAKNASSDALVEQLAKRISIQEAELQRLSKDYEANEGLIKTKEEELRKTKELLQGLEDEVEQQKQRYEELYFSLDLCPVCESNIIELTPVEDHKYAGTYRAYACGYADMQGEVYGLCPHDTNYPEFDEFELTIELDKHTSIWIGRALPKTDRAKKVRLSNEVGGTKEEVERLFRDAYVRKRSKNPNWTPSF